MQRDPLRKEWRTAQLIHYASGMALAVKSLVPDNCIANLSAFNLMVQRRQRPDR